MSEVLTKKLQQAGAKGVELPDPLYKKTLRSLCCEAGVKQAKDIECVEVVAANYSKIRYVWNGWWTCNSCGARCMAYAQTVVSKHRPIHRFQLICLDEAYGFAHPNRAHLIDTDTCQCSCGSDTVVTSVDTRSESWYAHLRRSKQKTFHYCTSRDKAKEIGCPHSDRCKMCTESKKAWAMARESQDGSSKHFEKCPAAVDAPRPPKKFYSSNSFNIQKAREKGEKMIEEIFDGLFDNTPSELSV